MVISRRLRRTPVLAVLRAADVAQLAPVCDVLVDEGIDSLEFTLTTPGLPGALASLAARYAGRADVGVGTVSTLIQAQRCCDDGAQFLVTPTMNLDVVQYAVSAGVPVFPGGLTPTELAAGWQAGATAVKLFPAATVGPSYIGHLHGPFPDLAVIPSGGVDIASVGEWLDAGAVAVSLGGPLLGDALGGGDLDRLRVRARDVLARVATHRDRDRRTSS